jgi:hypothetical protein
LGNKAQVLPVCGLIKACMAEFILKAAAEGQTTYGGLSYAASGQIQRILSMLT